MPSFRQILRIDLIYVGDDDTLILAEFKGKSYSPRRFINDRGEISTAQAKTITTLTNYVRTRPIGHDVAAGGSAILARWLQANSVQPGTTFKSLFESGRIITAGVVAGEVPATLQDEMGAPFVLFGVTLAASKAMARLTAVDGKYRPGTDTAVRAAVERAAATHSQAKKTTTTHACDVRRNIWTDFSAAQRHQRRSPTSTGNSPIQASASLSVVRVRKSPPWCRSATV